MYEQTRSLQGDTHPDTLDSLSEVARQLRLAGDLIGAEAVQARVVNLRTEVWGEGDYGTFRAKHLLAGYMSELGELDNAKRIQEELLEEATRYFTNDPEVMFPATLNLANTLYARAEFARAADLYERSTELSGKIHGPNDQMTIDAMGGWILSLRQLGRGNEAETIEKQRRMRERKRIAQDLRTRLQRKRG